MKAHTQYFTIDLTQRPAHVSKRGAIRRAFEMAAEHVADAALNEGEIPREVLVMVTLAPKPILPATSEADAETPAPSAEGEATP